jgi:hypothetical protein
VQLKLPVGGEAVRLRGHADANLPPGSARRLPERAARLLHRRADAPFALGDALLCAPAIPSLPHLSLEPVHQRGWGSVYAALPAAASTPSSCGICWCAAGQPPTR